MSGDLAQRIVDRLAGRINQFLSPRDLLLGEVGADQGSLHRGLRI
jgi:hypothetical protein